MQDAEIPQHDERFERRLVEEASELRVEMGRQGADLRQEVAQLGTDLRREMAQQGADLRQEMHAGFGDTRKEMHAAFGDIRKEMYAGFGDIRKEMYDGFTDIRQEVHAGFTGLGQDTHAGFGLVRREAGDNRVELLKWAFVFWVGQLVSVGGLIALMFRQRPQAGIPRVFAALPPTIATRSASLRPGAFRM